MPPKAFDPGPPSRFAAIFAACPPPPDPKAFWTAWGPVFYRGRLDGSARVLCIASDPGPTERVAGRTLVGDAGQRVQGFLSKLGLTRSYLCLNAFPYALFPSRGGDARAFLTEEEQARWRNRLYDAARSPSLQAVVAFGANARMAVELWPGRPDVEVVGVPHPSSRDNAALLKAWRAAVERLRAVVTPDPEGDASGSYGGTFRESDYAAIPRADLPFGVPEFVGDDAWGRAARPRHNNCVRRPVPDDRHTLIWRAPRR